MTTRHYCPACGGGLASKPAGSSLSCTRCDWRLITLAEWKKLAPFGQGYAMYMQGHWPTSALTNVTNPYAKGSRKYKAFEDGEQRAAMSAQDSEE